MEGGETVSDNRRIFIIPGRPVPAVRMTQKSKFKDPAAQKYLAYKDLVGWTAKTKFKNPFKGNIAVTVFINLKKGQAGDIDNYVKSILDGCNKIAWRDDRQVVEIHAYKFKKDYDAQEFAEVMITEMEA